MPEADWKFAMLPAAMEFYPTMEEFSNPLKYMCSIRGQAASSGIIKIVPPQGWAPPFSVDVDKFQFTPRVQKLNELEAKSRCHFQFMEGLAKFWHLQGVDVKIPNVEYKPLDLYALHKFVLEFGGFEKACVDKKWTAISKKLGFKDRSPSQQIKTNYEKLVWPYVVFRRVHCGETGETDNSKNITAEVIKEKMETSDYKNTPKSELGNGDDDRKEVLYENLFCKICRRGDRDDAMLLCDECDDPYHIYCLNPPLERIPVGEWRCPQCLAKEIDNRSFGFEQAKKEYTLTQFGQMADNFKSRYFKMPAHNVPIEKIEEEFWRLVCCVEEDVAVEYGADLLSTDLDSGFPTSDNCKSDVQKEYARDPWNLTHFADLYQSVLKYINEPISGVKVPWVYVGMVFSSFCWHVEDHWTYSINYQHWGETKVWYGVPDSGAEDLEQIIRQEAPELFTKEPSLMHQLVTTISPKLLHERGVPVFTIRQKPGEFVVTLPRAYHAGFNTGFNFNEACNFATADWIPLGRQSVEQYRKYGRFNVFSHEELMMKMVSKVDDLQLDVGEALLVDLEIMIEQELEARTMVAQNKMVGKEEFVEFELVPDEKRVCTVCNTTIFLSTIVCECEPVRMYCLDHTRACSCSSKKCTLKYRYTMQQLPGLKDPIVQRLPGMRKWTASVAEVFNRKTKPTIEELEHLLSEAVRQKFTTTEEVGKIRKVIDKAQQCIKVTNQLVSLKRRSTRVGSNSNSLKVSVEELDNFLKQVGELPCHIPDSATLQEHLFKVREFQAGVTSALQRTLTESQLEELLRESKSLDIDLPETSRLKMELKRVQWCSSVTALIEAPGATLESLQNALCDGSDLPNTVAIDALRDRVETQLMEGQRWEERAQTIINSRPRPTMGQLSNLLGEVDQNYTLLPSVAPVRSAITRGTEWCRLMSDVKLDQSKGLYTSLKQLESLLLKGQMIPVALPDLDRLVEKVSAAKQWQDRASKLFVRKGYSKLLEAISPRQIDSCTDSTPLEELLKGNTMKEFTEIKKRRSDNMLRTEQEETGEISEEDNVYCICRRGVDGAMTQCDLCYDWFHNKCVTLPKQKNSPDETLKDLKFLCPLCQRTKRPTVAAALSLLISLRQAGLVLPEGVALSYLVERGMEWQEKVRQVLVKHKDLATAEDKQCYISQNISIHDRNQIEELMIKGDVIELSLEETHDLWALLGIVDNHEVHEKKTGPVKVTTPTAPPTKRRKNDSGDKANNVPKKKKRERKTITADDSCSMKNCSQPEGAKVGWIQCDRCEKWYHWDCVSLTTDEAQQIEDYTCPVCIPEYNATS